MAQIPDDIKEGIISLSERIKVPKKKLLAELKEVLTTDETVKGLPKAEAQIRLGWTVVLRRYLSGGKTTEMYIRPANYPRPMKVKTKGEKKYNCRFACVARLVDNESEEIGKPLLAAGTLWENAAENTMNLSPHKVYKTSLKYSEVDGGVSIGGNDAVFTETDKVKVPTIQTYYEKKIKPNEENIIIELADMKINNAENDVDIRVINVMIMDYGVGVNTNNEEYGNYTVTDNSIIKDKDSEGRYTVWLHPKEITEEKGSKIKLIGICNYDKANKIARWTTFFYIPTDSNPIMKKEGTKEEMDASDLLDDDDDITPSTNENEGQEESTTEDDDLDDDFVV